MSRQKNSAADSRRIEATVWQLAEPAAEAEGAELIDVEFVREAGEWYLRLFLDREGTPVDHDLCQAVSERVSDLLDQTDPIEQGYYLEVSSPGLERPLKRERDFERYRGEMITVRLYAPKNGKKEYSGLLQGLIDDCVVLEAEGETLSFPLEQTAKVHLKADF